MLLNYKANANIKASAGKENMTPLGYATSKGHYDVVKYLVENGAIPEFKSEWKNWWIKKVVSLVEFQIILVKNG